MKSLESLSLLNIPKKVRTEYCLEFNLSVNIPLQQISLLNEIIEKSLNNFNNLVKISLITPIRKNTPVLPPYSWVYLGFFSESKKNYHGFSKSINKKNLVRRACFFTTGGII